MGLYGEVGGIMATAKKHVREEKAYPGFRRAAEEEFGDTLWYLAAYCRRRQVSLDSILRAATQGTTFVAECAASDFGSGAVEHVIVPSTSIQIDDTLFQLGLAAAALLEASNDETLLVSRLETCARCFLSALHASQLSFAVVARMNIARLAVHSCRLTRAHFLLLMMSSPRKKGFLSRSEFALNSEGLEGATYAGTTCSSETH